jgi:SAM-dependent methyltransferase
MNFIMSNYYSKKLAGDRLRKCYEVAPPRVRQYLKAEIQFVINRLQPADRVLELGCGYGRVLQELSGFCKYLVGIDTSRESLEFAKTWMKSSKRCRLIPMDAIQLGFMNRSFDLTFCIQNGICAFRIDSSKLLQEALRVTRSAGKVLLSSYSEKFWEERLAWFRIQAYHGLVGELDEEAIGNGQIVCRDGFKVGTMSPSDFKALCASLNNEFQIIEVDDSSLFCEVAV